jgi:hypothetical protein
MCATDQSSACKSKAKVVLTQPTIEVLRQFQPAEDEFYLTPTLRKGRGRRGSSVSSKWGLGNQRVSSAMSVKSYQTYMS